jgi:phage baseplate assembly protein W
MDKPLDVAAMMYVAEVYRVVDLYEPRAKVKDVKYTGVDNEGNMQFRCDREFDHSICGDRLAKDL